MKTDTNKYLLIYQATREYLRIAAEYTAHFGKLEWSMHEDAVVSSEGKLFASNAAIGEFVEGYGSGGRAISFSFLLHAMELLQNRRRLSHPQAQRLHRAFHNEESPWRNAGALVAVLTRSVPEVSPGPSLRVVSARLRDTNYSVRWFIQEDAGRHIAVEPPLTPHQFEDVIFDAAEAYTNDELQTWFGTGRGPVHEPARQAAQAMAPLPRTLSGVLATLLRRPRLAGAETYVTQMVGALTLPPRRWSPPELPVGGYADMVTRGQVEQILPSQHALDDLEFLRRFAEHELLYFRREEPPARNDQEWVVLLDQGVRTWGDVRLVLSAAAVALGKMADKRGVGFRFGATSNGGHTLDPLIANETELGKLAEASDLTLNPAEALEQALQTPCEHLRDVVLLTHPRNLREPDVLAAARRLGARDRLFALTLDAQGRAALCEIRHGAAIVRSRFHVEFKPSQPPPAAVRLPASRDLAWTGDVEAIPFPFKIGSTGPIEHLDFDNHGSSMLTVDKRGVLQLWHLDDEVCETLPRVQYKEKALVEYLAIMGVPGGFVMAGKYGYAIVLVHLDLARRKVTARASPQRTFSEHLNSLVWFRYSPTYHCVVLEHDVHQFVAYDLDAETFHTIDGNDGPTRSRGALACRDASLGRLPRYQREWKAVNNNGSSLTPENSVFQWNSRTGEINLRGSQFGDVAMTPLSDGKPILVGHDILFVDGAGFHVLVKLGRDAESRRFLLLNGATQSVVRDYPQRWNKTLILRAVLSPDGTRVALLLANHRVVVDTIATGNIFTTRPGGFSHDTDHYFSERGVAICSGTNRRVWHFFRWTYGVLTHSIAYHSSPSGTSGSMPWQSASEGGRLPQSPLTVRVGQFGQLQIQNQRGDVLASFFAFRGQVAAWMPDGTRYGAESLHLGPATPAAAEKIGKALIEAEKEASVRS
jgi:hypothetical protein